MSKYKIIKRKEFIEKMKKISNDIAQDIVGPTMTSIGSYGTLDDGKTTNDGATIVERLVESGWKSDDDVARHYIKRLHEATSRTDELAGDGTSATTVMTAALINLINENKINIETVGELKKFENNAIHYLNEHVTKLKSENDYIKLATISTKDEELGKMIGKAFYKGGTNAMVTMRASKKARDYVDIESNFIVPTYVNWNGIPKEMKNPIVVIANAELNNETEFMTKAHTKAYSEGKDIVIVCKGVGERMLNYTQANNTANKQGRVSYIVVPEKESDRWLEDISKYTGAKVNAVESFMIGGEFKEEIFGSVDEFRVADRTILLNKEKKPSLKKHLEELNEKLKSLNMETSSEKIKDLRYRINLLDGKTIILYIYAQNESLLKTKILKIEDAIKSTQYTLGFGYVPGAGVFYREMKAFIEDNEFNDSLDSIQDMICKIIGRKNDVDWESKRTTHTVQGRKNPNATLDGYVISVDRDGTVKTKVKNVLSAGVIDSGKVIENVIRNSVAIATEIASVGFFMERVEDEVK